MTSTPQIGHAERDDPGRGVPATTDPGLVADVALRLSRDFADWVRRRVETVSYVGDTTVRRQVSVDFVLPHADSRDEADPLRELRPGDSILIPLALFKKQPFSHFDVWDETGRTLSVLNTRENGDLAARALTQLVRSGGGGGGNLVFDPDGIETQQIRQIAMSAGTDATTALEAAAAMWLDELFPAGESERALFDDLAESFMLLTPAPYVPGEHRIIKYAYDESFGWTGSGQERSSRTSRVMVALGWQDKAMSLDHPIGLAEGYHVEIVAPEDVVIADAFMSAVQLTPSGEQRQTESEATNRGVDGSVRGERVHLEVRSLAARDDSEKIRGDRGRSIFVLRARRAGTFRALLATTTLIALIIAGTRMRIGHLDDTTAATVLLVFPAVLAAYLTRPGEHAFATRLLALVRGVALVSAVCGLATAGMLGGGLLGTPDGSVGKPTRQCGTDTASRTGTIQEASFVQRYFSCVTVPGRQAALGPPHRNVEVLDLLLVISVLSAGALWLAQVLCGVLDRESTIKARRAKLAARHGLRGPANPTLPPSGS